MKTILKWIVCSLLNRHCFSLAERCFDIGDDSQSVTEWMLVDECRYCGKMRYIKTLRTTRP